MQQFFEIEKASEGKARAGNLYTDHGKIETPIFMPVGTVASVKTVHQHELKDDIKAQERINASRAKYDELKARMDKGE